MFPTLTDLHKISWITLGIVPLIIAVYLWMARKKALEVLWVLLVSVGLTDFICGTFIKHWFERSRPVDVMGTDVIVRTSHYAGYSFPSNHAANMFAAAVVIHAFYPKRAPWAFAAAALVAFMRVYLGVHFPSDVVGGAVIGGLVAWSVLQGWNWFRRRTARLYF